MRTYRVIALFVLVGSLLAFWLSPAALAASAGQLDPSFNTTGIALTNFGSDGLDTAGAMAIQPDGKYVVAGIHETAVAVPNNVASTTKVVTLVRFDHDGTLDPSFGTGGKVEIDLRSLYEAAYGDQVSFRGVGAIALQPGTGRIFVASGGDVENGFIGQNAVACFTAAGAPDTTWGHAGFVRVDDGSPASVPTSWQDDRRVLVAQPDGKLLFASTVRTLIHGDDFTIFRLNADGTPDASFGTNGNRQVDIANGSQDQVEWMVLAGGGRIIVGGSCQGRDTAMAALTPNGALDTSFGAGGKVVTSEDSGWAIDAALAPDGGLIAVGGNGPADWVRRYTANGALDTSFGTNAAPDGSALPPNGQTALFPPGSDERTISVRTVTVQADGRIVIAGIKDSGYPTYNDIWVTRYSSTGLLDTLFGTNGRSVTDFGGADDCAAVGVDAANNIVVAGYSLPSGSAGRERLQARAAGAIGMGVARYVGLNRDKHKPSTKATAARVIRGKWVTLRFRVLDPPPTCGRAFVKIVIMKGTKRIKAISLGKQKVNKALACRFKVTLKPGTYRYRVFAVDLAGNVATSIGSARLSVIK